MLHQDNNHENLLISYYHSVRWIFVSDYTDPQMIHPRCDIDQVSGSGRDHLSHKTPLTYR